MEFRMCTQDCNCEVCDFNFDLYTFGRYVRVCVSFACFARFAFALGYPGWRLHVFASPLWSLLLASPLPDLYLALVRPFA